MLKISKIVRLKTVDSTNIYALHRLKSHQCNENTVFIAEEQTAGRGQLQNSWESTGKKNLLLSVVLFSENIAACSIFDLSKSISLSLIDFLNEILPSGNKSEIKWPNDIYVNNRKICGILIENSIKGQSVEYSVIGIGLNINQEHFGKYPVSPVSLKMLTGETYNLNKCLEAVIQKIENRFIQLESGEKEKIDSEYLNRLYRLGEYAYYKDENGMFKGKITGVDSFGRLNVLVNNNNLLSYENKEIRFI